MGCSGSRSLDGVVLAACWPLSGRRGEWSWTAIPSSMGLTGCDWTALDRRHTEVVLRGPFGPVRARDEIEVRSTQRTGGVGVCSGGWGVVR